MSIKFSLSPLFGMNRKAISAFLLAVAAILAITALNPLTHKARAQTFFGAERFPAMDVDAADNIYLMMSVATAPASEHRPHSQIFFTMSDDGGRSWDNSPQTRNLSNSPGEAFGPSLVVNRFGKTRVYVAYQDTTPGPTQAFLIRSKKGTKFRRPANITPHNGGAFSPRVALDSSEAVNIVWGDTNSNTGKVVFVRSTDQGETFTAPLDLSKSSGVAFEPEIAVDPGNAINVVWQDTAPGTSAIMFSRSTDGGGSFSAPKQISKGTGAATEAAIASDAQGRLSVTWVDASSGGSQAYYSRSTDGGQTFSTPINASNLRDADVHKPTLTTFQNTVYLAFQNGGLYGEDDVRNQQVYLVKSEDAGVTFGDAELVSHADNSKGRAHSPAMVVDSRGVLHISWIDASIVGNDEGLLFYSRTSNGHQFTQQFMILALI
jgi:hypothetical protein